MLGLIEHLARQNREDIFLKTLQWIFDLPNFILRSESKLKFINNLFNLNIPIEERIDISFTESFGHLRFQVKQSVLYLLSLNHYSRNSDFYKREIDHGHVIGIIYDNDSPDNLASDSLMVISYSRLIKELNKLDIHDHKTQYIVGDLIDGLKKFEKVEQFK